MPVFHGPLKCQTVLLLMSSKKLKPICLSFWHSSDKPSQKFSATPPCSTGQCAMSLFFFFFSENTGNNTSLLISGLRVLTSCYTVLFWPETSKQLFMIIWIHRSCINETVPGSTGLLKKNNKICRTNNHFQNN